MRIIPPHKKSDAKSYEWHNVHDVFQSPTELKTRLMDTFKDKIPDTYNFQVGYHVKKGSGKRWIEQEADLVSMYKHYEGSDTITLFCDGKTTTPTGRKRKHSATSGIASNENVSANDHEEEVKQTALELSDRHQDRWNMRQYQIWARMFVNNQWDSLDEPPNIPLITGSAKKIPRRENLSEAISGAAVAFAKVLTDQNKGSQGEIPANKQQLSTGISPASKAKLSREYISQLKELQDLRQCGVLDEDEFQEQKMFALNNLRSMNK